MLLIGSHSEKPWIIPRMMALIMLSKSGFPCVCLVSFKSVVKVCCLYV